MGDMGLFWGLGYWYDYWVLYIGAIYIVQAPFRWPEPVDQSISVAEKVSSSSLFNMLSSGIIRPPEVSCPRFVTNTGYFPISFSVILMRSRLLEATEFSIRRIFICL